MVDGGTAVNAKPAAAVAATPPHHPPLPPLPPRRSSQVAELVANLPAAEALNRDATLFQVPLTLPNGTATHLRVALPPAFPSTPPSLSLAARVRHTWVDAAGRVTTPELAAWGARSRLAAAVGEAVAALSADAGPPSASPSPAKVVARAAVPKAFVELEEATREELEAWVTDPGAFAALAARAAARLAPTPSPTPPSNALALAKATMAKEATLRELRTQAAVIRSSEFEAAAGKAASLAARQRRVADAIAPAALVAGLKQAAAAADAASGREYDSFLAAGGSHVDSFVAAYVRARTSVHRCELKAAAAAATLVQGG